MNSDTNALQRISKLAPLAEIYGKIDTLVQPVKAREIELNTGLSRILAADVASPLSLPRQSISLRDGWAVRAELVADASSYAPVSLAPKPIWVEVGQPLPPETDAVLAADAVTIAGTNFEALAPVTAGEGTLVASGDVKAGGLLRKTGERLRAMDLAILSLAGVRKVSVREPIVSIFRAGTSAHDDNGLIVPFIASAINARGGRAQIKPDGSLEQILENKNSDAVVVVGGSGAGRNDKSVLTLARMGEVVMHGMGIQPGETAALGKIETRPILILPGRFDATLSILLIVGFRLLARLSGQAGADLPLPTKTARKIASQVGIAEFVPLECTKEGAIPLASGQLSLNALARADGWTLVPAESEGYPAGTSIDMWRLP